MSRTELLTDAQWELIAPLMPSSQGRRGRPFADHRTVVEGIIYRYRTGIAWRDLPGCFGPWQTVWKRHRRFSGDGTWDKIHSVLLAHADAAGLIDWEVSVDSTINRAHQHATNLPRDTGGPDEFYTNLRIEPPDHAIGRSRGGLSTKIHHLCDGNMRPLVMLLGPGQGGDSPMFEHVMNALRVPRLGGGRPRTRPDRALGDKAYSSRANRKLLRRRGIQAVIPERDDQIANRKRRGAKGGRPVTYDTEAYKRRNVVERGFNIFKQWRALATRYDKLALRTSGGGRARRVRFGG
ncbi:IS5 family transposase [Microbacterium sp. PAMC 28756]|uniref:IS5 family transposase n=1 Tax=Microbacterium sp. PAMC 28756 TaxID=1795053 RepID=UPI0018D237E6